VRRQIAALGHDDGMPGSTEPLPAAEVGVLLRRLVLAFKAGEKRRVFPPVLHVGDPAGVRVSYEARASEALDADLRTEVVGALLCRARAEVPDPWVWLTRPGELTWHDADSDWVAAARTAYAEAGLPLRLVVVTRRGWYEPLSGTRREWRRLRQR
jgi:hypothetical protein